MYVKIYYEIAGLKFLAGFKFGRGHYKFRQLILKDLRPLSGTHDPDLLSRPAWK